MAAAEGLALAFLEDHPADAARLLERADPADAAGVLAGVSADVAAAVYAALAPPPAAACAGALSDEALAAIVQELAVDAGAAALRALDAGRRTAVLALVEPALGERLAALLAYPQDSAAALADPLALALPTDLTVGDARRELSGARRHVFYYLYVVARDRTLLGATTLPELMEAPAQATLGDVMRRDPVRLEALTDLATVAMHPGWRELDALPVVDRSGRLIGAIRHQTIRQMSWNAGQPGMATLVGLSELYWIGLSGILASLAAAPRGAGEGDHGA